MTAERIPWATERIAHLQQRLGEVVVGQEELLRGVTTGLVAGGNILIEGAPGLGKTLLVRTLAEALDLPFARIQFTPDLMPADITGGLTLVQGDLGGTEVVFRRGPLFASIVLADEVNRGTPKTQSALLEAMQEHAVTVSGERHALPEPFAVIATQNPSEMHGTYPLPEAQLDRFLFKVTVGFPSIEALKRIGVETTGPEEAHIEPVLSGAELQEIQHLAREIVVADEVVDLCAKLVQATHPGRGGPEVVSKYVRHGASPRAMQALILAGRAQALAAGREWVNKDDIMGIAEVVLAHRLFLNVDAGIDGVQGEAIVQSVLSAFR